MDEATHREDRKKSRKEHYLMNEQIREIQEDAKRREEQEKRGWFPMSNNSQALIRQEEQYRQDEQRRQDNQRQEDQRRQDEQRRQDNQRQESQRKQEERNRQEYRVQEQKPVLDEIRRRETDRKVENMNRAQEKVIDKGKEKLPQNQELMDLANTHDKYEKLIRSGHYDELRNEKVEGKAVQEKEQSPLERFKEKQEVLKPKVQEALKSWEQNKTHDLGRER